MRTRDRLVAIPAVDLPQLRDLYLADWPRNISGYSIVETCCRWLQQHRVRGASSWFQIYSLNGDWRSDGTFVCVVSLSRLRL